MPRIYCAGCRAEVEDHLAGERDWQICTACQLPICGICHHSETCQSHVCRGTGTRLITRTFPAVPPRPENIETRVTTTRRRRTFLTWENIILAVSFTAMVVVCLVYYFSQPETQGTQEVPSYTNTISEPFKISPISTSQSLPQKNNDVIREAEREEFRNVLQSNFKDKDLDKFSISSDEEEIRKLIFDKKK